MGAPGPLRVLILCTGNSARSQIAEALINHKGAGRVVAASAGSRPAPRVNPLAPRVLADAGIEFRGHPPQGIDAVFGQPWDVIITVCDNAKEACPVFPGQPVTAHWSMPDPTEAGSSEAEQLAAFRETLNLLRRRVEAMLALPHDSLDKHHLEQKIRAIAQVM